MSRKMMIAAFGAAALGTLTALPAAAEWAPNKPIEFVVASGAGGGTDQFARLVQSIIQKHELLKVPVIVSNKGGGAGTEAFVYGKLAGNDAHKVIFGTNNEWLLPLVTKAGYKFDDLKPVAALAVDEFLLWTHANAPYKTPQDFIDAAKKGKLRVGGSQSKDTDQILVKRIEKAAGVEFIYVPFKSGGEAATQLAGTHIEANFNNPQENVGQWKGGAVRPLCVFSPTRLTYNEKVAGDMAWSDIPTCKESGIAVEQYQMPRTVWMPGGVSDEQVAFYVGLMDKVRQTPEFKDWLKRTSQSAAFVTGKDFDAMVAKDEAENRALFQEQGWLVN
jgi:putative tricarboxylic transport membrane protein